MGRRVLDPPELATKLPLGEKGNPSPVARCHPALSIELGLVWDLSTAAAPARVAPDQSSPFVGLLLPGLLGSCRVAGKPPWTLAAGLASRERLGDKAPSVEDGEALPESCLVAYLLE